jgi:RNA polymerase sigma-70 factor (ECF subfamily)
MKAEKQRNIPMSGIELEFEQIYAEFHPKIHRYLIRMVGELEAEDLTQDVFVKLSQALKTFRGEAKLSTWIYRIATNAALDRLRSPKFQVEEKVLTEARQIASGEAEIVDRNTWTGEQTPLVESQVYRKEMADCLQGYIHQLPGIYRTILVLSHMEELGNQEVADVLGLTLETVKIRLHRARDLLRRELAENCPLYWVVDNEFLPELAEKKDSNTNFHGKRTQRKPISLK